jgi:hypothetical protein
MAPRNATTDAIAEWVVEDAIREAERAWVPHEWTVELLNGEWVVRTAEGWINGRYADEVAAQEHAKWLRAEDKKTAHYLARKEREEGK